MDKYELQKERVILRRNVIEGLLVTDDISDCAKVIDIANRVLVEFDRTFNV